MTTATENAYESILSLYTPLDVKDILLHGASRKAKHHKTEEDILTWYAEFNEGLHHTLLVRQVAQIYKEMYQQDAVGLYTTSDMEFI